MDTQPEQSIVIENRTITAEDFLLTHQTATAIKLEYCTSSQWNQVGVAVASLLHLRILTLSHCKVDDSFFKQLSKSKSIRRLQTGNPGLVLEHCDISEIGAIHISTIGQLE